MTFICCFKNYKAMNQRLRSQPS